MKLILHIFSSCNLFFLLSGGVFHELVVESECASRERVEKGQVFLGRNVR
jgi:hypothetical protein